MQTTTTTPALAYQLGWAEARRWLAREAQEIGDWHALARSIARELAQVEAQGIEHEHARGYAGALREYV